MDTEGPIADEEMGTVEIPPTDPPLDEEDLEDVLCHIDTKSSFEDFGLQHYIECKELLQNYNIL